MRNLLGGKGCELAEMTNLGIPVPPGFTITTQAWAALQPGRPPVARRAVGADRSRTSHEARAGCRARASAIAQAAAAGVRPLRRPRVDAGHDGDRPQPRPQRRDRRWAGGVDAQRALRVGLLPALHHDVRRRGARASSARPSTRSSTRSRSRLGVASDPEVPAAELRKLVEAFKELVSSRTGRPFPAGSARAAAPGHQRRLRLVVRQEGDRVPADQQRSPPTGARR